MPTARFLMKLVVTCCDSDNFIGKDCEMMQQHHSALETQQDPLHPLSFHGNGFGCLVLWRQKGTYGYNSAQVNGSYASSFSQEVPDVYGLDELQAYYEAIEEPGGTFVAGEAQTRSIRDSTVE
ncbi:Pol polyprotein [Plakobranchus ocellatus]|uniref:Pol polyprotein n=1 Tax=Plakobranchus ocellatus TaxID=259542 RepID=A0AAV3YRF7_9GAST|nr:Pol polyprotein [Plakobranchus ocellatus]